MRGRSPRENLTRRGSEDDLLRRATTDDARTLLALGCPVAFFSPSAANFPVFAPLFHLPRRPGRRYNGTRIVFSLEKGRIMSDIALLVVVVMFVVAVIVIAVFFRRTLGAPVRGCTSFGKQRHNKE